MVEPCFSGEAHSRIIIHQPLGGVQGQASDIDIQAREILRMREVLNQILADHTDQDLERIVSRSRSRNSDFHKRWK